MSIIGEKQGEQKVEEEQARSQALQLHQEYLAKIDARDRFYKQVLRALWNMSRPPMLADTDLEDARIRLEEVLWYPGFTRPLPAPQFRSIEEVNWVEAWKQHYHPIPIGQKLIIVPAWLEIPPGDYIPIRIDPGKAFGTGTHPTTQLCLEIIEDVARRAGNLTDVIDIGCGSGILSIAALKLGAGRALGVDIDPQALVTARENATLNGITAHLEIGAGSVAEIRAGVFGLRQAPLVLANILIVVLIPLLNAGLGDLITPGGYLVLSGILEEQAADVETVARDHGLHIVNRRQLGDWVALLINHPAEALSAIGGETCLD